MRYVEGESWIGSGQAAHAGDWAAYRPGGEPDAGRTAGSQTGYAPRDFRSDTWRWLRMGVRPSPAERSLRLGFSLSGDTGAGGSGAPECGPGGLPDPCPESRQSPADGRFEERLEENRSL